MPKFKQKNTRKILVENNSITTLDGKHQEIVDELRREKEVVVPSLRKEQRSLRKKLQRNKMSVEAELETKDRMEDIKRTLREIKGRERNYLLNNSELVFGYFENKMKVAEGTNKTTVLNTFFKTSLRSTPSLKENTDAQHLFQGKITEDLLRILEIDHEILKIDTEESIQQIERIIR